LPRSDSPRILTRFQKRDTQQTFMSKSYQTVRQKLHALGEERLTLPGMTSLKKPAFAGGGIGIAAAERGAFATDEEVRNAFALSGPEGLKLHGARSTLG
jgi:hypothetical protein